MNSRERIKNAINFMDSDKIPIDFGASPVTGMHVSCIAELREYYGLEKRPVKVIEPYQMLGEIDDELKEIIGIDVVGLVPMKNLFGFENKDWKSWEFENGLEVLVPGMFNTTVDSSGNTYIYPEGDLKASPSGKMPKGGHFFDTIVRQDKIDEDNLNPEDNLEEFQLISERKLNYYKKSVMELSGTGRAVIANFGESSFGDIALIPAPSLKKPKGIRDIAEWYMSTAIRQDYVHHIFSKQLNIAIHNLNLINEEMGQYIDIIFACGTDFGTQISCFLSPETFKELYMPYYVKLNKWIHENTEWKTFKHSCGAIEPLIPYLIESGFDILNPIQCSAKGMDAQQIADKYKHEIVFWGGGVDTQQTLPFGTPQEVFDQVIKRCGIFGDEGGFVFNSIHNIQANTPIENIVAMIDAIKKYNS